MELFWNTTSVCLLVTTLILYFLYRWAYSSADYWKTQGVPSFKPSLVGYVRMIFTPLHELELKLYRKFGPIYGRYDGHIPVLTVGDPDILKNILIKDFSVFQNRRDCQFGDPVMDNNISLVNGEDWKRIRNIITPAFTSGKLKLMLNKMHVCADVIMKKMNTAAQSKTPIDLETLMNAYVMDALASCVFGTKLSCLENPNHPFILHAKSFLTSGVSLRGILAQFFPLLMKVFRISMFNPASVRFFRDFTIQAILKRGESNELQTDFLSLLLEAKKSGSFTCENNSQNSEANCKTKESEKPKSRTKFLTQDELIAQCVTFFLAGFDTTSSLIRFTLANLALYPDSQQRLYQEINNTLDEKVGIEYDDVMTMKYLDAVIAESLRMCTAAIRIDRKAETNYTIASKGIQIKKGQLVSVPIYAMHHNPEWYPEPEKFDPERFTQEAKISRHPLVYLPFGVGPRSCVGNRFALLEAKLILTLLIKRFKVEPAPGTKVPLQFKVKQGQLTPANVYVMVTMR